MMQVVATVLGKTVRLGTVVEIESAKSPTGRTRGPIVEMPEPGFPGFTIDSETLGRHHAGRHNILAVIG